MQLKTLRELKPTESGRIVQINSGQGMISRLDTLNIRLGKRVTKLSSSFMRGPVTIEVDRTQVAIGFGIASRIMVEVGDNDR